MLEHGGDHFLAEKVQIALRSGRILTSKISLNFFFEVCVLSLKRWCLKSYTKKLQQPTKSIQLKPITKNKTKQKSSKKPPAKQNPHTEKTPNPKNIPPNPQNWTLVNIYLVKYKKVKIHHRLQRAPGGDFSSWEGELGAEGSPRLTCNLCSHRTQARSSRLLEEFCFIRVHATR